MYNEPGSLKSSIPMSSWIMSSFPMNEVAKAPTAKATPRTGQRPSAPVYSTRTFRRPAQPSRRHCRREPVMDPDRGLPRIIPCMSMPTARVGIEHGNAGSAMVLEAKTSAAGQVEWALTISHKRRRTVSAMSTPNSRMVRCCGSPVCCPRPRHQLGKKIPEIQNFPRKRGY